MPTKKKLYSYYVTVTQANGEKKQLKFSSVSKKEAKAKRDKAKWEYEAGLMVFSKNTTVARYAEKWQEQRGLDQENRGRLKRCCLDLIGGLEVSEVRATHIRGLLRHSKGKEQKHDLQDLRPD